MTKAAGFFNTMLESDDPALIIENLNGYRLKEKLPDNFGKFRTPVGVVETIMEGDDITLVSYGSTLKLVVQAAQELRQLGISCEIIDIQSLMPFDLDHNIAKSVKKTNRLMVIDEDVPGGASAYILNEILNTQDAYHYLDSKPITLCSEEHRPAYGTDGDYFSNKSPEDIFEAIEYTHQLGKKIYLTTNILPHNRKILPFMESLNRIFPHKPDGYITSDPGLIMMMKV